MRRRIATLGMLALAACPLAAESSGRVVAGVERARWVPPAGAVVRPYENAGYAMRFRGGAIEVEVSLDPLRSDAPWVAPAVAPAGVVERLAVEVATGAATEYEAAGRVLAWIRRSIRYDLNRDVPQSPEDVLRRRSGYCTGVARLGVAMLRSVGLEAREVPGYVLGPPGGGAVEGFHRWVEFRLSDRGWVFSDPLASHHFVPATYLRLAEERLAESPGTAHLLSRSGAIEEIDLAPGVPEGVRVRPNDDRRHAAALVLRLDTPGPAVAELSDERARRRVDLAGGEARFLGLATGNYELRVVADGRLTAWKRLVFRRPVLAELVIPGPDGTAEPEWGRKGR